MRMPDQARCIGVTMSQLMPDHDWNRNQILPLERQQETTLADLGKGVLTMSGAINIVVPGFQSKQTDSSTKSHLLPENKVGGGWKRHTGGVAGVDTGREPVIPAQRYRQRLRVRASF
jgi:hypothetical protein